MNHVPMNHEWIPTSGRSSPLRALESLPGLVFSSSSRASVWAGKTEVDVRLEGSGTLTLHAEVSPDVGDAEAFSESSSFEGNLRYAIHRERLILLADVTTETTDLHAKVSKLLKSISRWESTTVPNTPTATDGVHESPCDPGESILEESFLAAGFGADAVVRRETGWEVRPRIDGRVWPVIVNDDGDSVHVYRQILSIPQNIPAVFSQALRFNARLRFARLVRGGDVDRGRDAVHAECRLDQPLSPSALSLGVKAVAAASHHATDSLRLLAEEPAVADCYGRLFSLS